MNYSVKYSVGRKPIYTISSHKAKVVNPITKKEIEYKVTDVNVKTELYV